MGVKNVEWLQLTPALSASQRGRKGFNSKPYFTTDHSPNYTPPDFLFLVPYSLFPTLHPQNLET